jgi:hypothetical protein
MGKIKIKMTRDGNDLRMQVKVKNVSLLELREARNALTSQIHDIEIKESKEALRELGEDLAKL